MQNLINFKKLLSKYIFFYQNETEGGGGGNYLMASDDFVQHASVK